MKLLLLDKDGTLVSPASGARFVNKPWDQAALPNALETIDRYISEGWKPIIISNQGGVIAGHKSLEDAIAEMRFALELFPSIEEAYFCPDRGDTCWRVWAEDAIEYTAQDFDVANLSLAGRFRKPDPGMLLLAYHLEAEALELLYVGDMESDRQAAEAASIPYLDAIEWRSLS